MKKKLVVVLSIVVVIVIIVTRLFGLWPDWAIELELMVKTFIKYVGDAFR